MYKDVQFEEAKMSILDVFNDPHNHQIYAHRCVLLYRVWVLHETSVCCSRYSASVILRVTYGESNPISINDLARVRWGEARSCRTFYPEDVRDLGLTSSIVSLGQNTFPPDMINE